MLKTAKIIGVLTVVLIGGAGIGWYVASRQMKPTTTAQPTTSQSVPTTQRIESSPVESKTSQPAPEPVVVSNQLLLGDISMTLPTGWIVTSQTTTHAVIQTETDPYDVDLVVDKHSLSSEDVALYKDPSGGAGFDYHTISDGEIFQLGCGGPVSCNGVILGATGYNLTWEIKSTQPAPADSEGMWTPDHTLTNDDIQAIMESIVLVK